MRFDPTPPFEIERWVPIADGPNASDCLLAVCRLLGGNFHAQAIRVHRHKNGVQHALGIEFEHDLDHVAELNGSRGNLETISIDGFEGEYVVVIYPMED